MLLQAYLLVDCIGIEEQIPVAVPIFSTIPTSIREGVHGVDVYLGCLPERFRLGFRPQGFHATLVATRS